MILDNAMTCHFVRSSRSDRLFVRLSVVNAIIRKRMNRFLPRDARPMHKRGHGVKTPWRDAVMRCQCVCPSVTFVSCVKTNKHIFEIFSPLGSHTILVFPYQTGWRYSDGNPPNEGVECRWGRQKTRFWTNISLRCVQVYSVVNRRESTRTVKNKAATDGGECQAEAAEHSRFRRGCSHKTTTKCL